jgi:hypothetical protein
VGAVAVAWSIFATFWTAIVVYGNSRGDGQFYGLPSIIGVWVASAILWIIWKMST